MSDSYLQTDGARLPDVNEECPAEYAFCSRCRDNAVFVRDEYGDWVSECCGWPAIAVDAIADSYNDDFADFNLAEMEED